MSRPTNAGDARNGRLDWVDYAKGIGILLVVYGHVMIGVHGADMNMPEWLFNLSNDLVYGFHMPLFFLLSGLFAEKSVAKGFLKGLAPKCATLVLPYFVWSLIQGSVGVLLSNYKNSAMGWGQLVQIVYIPIAQFWFLYVLFLVFVLYFALRTALNARAILALSVAAYFLAPYLHTWAFPQLAENFVFFALGSVLMGVINGKIGAATRISSRTVWVALAAFAAVNAVYLFTPLRSYTFVKLAVALAGIGLTLAAASVWAGKGRARLLLVLGGASMSIYLMHILVGSGTRIILAKVFGMHDIAVHVLLGTLLGTALPLAADLILSRLGIGSLLLGKPPKRKWPRNSAAA